MDAGVFQLSMFFLLCIFFVSDKTTAQKPPLKALFQSGKLTSEENEIFFSSSNAVTELDEAPGNIPIVNPTTPTPTTPIVNPGNPPQPPAMPGPITNPTPASPQPPAMTGPITNPNPGSPSPPAMTGPTTNPTPNTNAPASAGGAWCIANPSASPTALQVALDYACGYGGADCSAIQPGASCYDPDTVKDHASYAFNDYYQKNPAPTSCVFGGAAQLTYTDPSYGNCHFASTSTKTPTAPPTPMTPTTPPSTTTPVNPYTPPGSSGFGSEPTEYGSEPTGTPSSAEMVAYKQLQLLIMTCLTLSFSAAIYL
ncbi:unnamed protein product [Coffea canephora]|uniref:X8 domain-containing protein n=2 Tax=Coffea TaxID=13442 RepID=A0A068V992_COFCA|nr:extensin-like [Coffea arabica]CDP17320.1 unnamed protein product [Coffea canephora]